MINHGFELDVFINVNSYKMYLVIKDTIQIFILNTKLKNCMEDIVKLFTYLFLFYNLINKSIISIIWINELFKTYLLNVQLLLPLLILLF